MNPLEPPMPTGLTRNVHIISTHQYTPFAAGEPVWLSAPTAGKLEPRWEGDWVIKSVKGPTNMEITNGKTTKVVHTNRLQHRNVPSPSDPNMDVTNEQWNAPTVDHVYVPPPLPTVPRRYPLRQ